MQPIFKFKDDEYTFKELFSMALTKKNIYQQGEVIKLYHFTTKDIQVIQKYKPVYNKDLLEDIEFELPEIGGLLNE